MLLELLKAALAIAIGVVIGVVSYAIKEYLARGKNEKYSARIISMDMFNAITILYENQKKSSGFPPHKLTLLPDWRKEFYNVHARLSIKEATILMEYYRLIEHLEDLRLKLEEYNRYLENDLKVPEFKANQMINISKSFNEIGMQLLKQDYNDLIEKLKSMS